MELELGLFSTATTPGFIGIGLALGLYSTTPEGAIDVDEDMPSVSAAPKL